jgi:hypothetical protein
MVRPPEMDWKNPSLDNIPDDLFRIRTAFRQNKRADL